MPEETPTNAPVDAQAPSAETEATKSPAPQGEAPITKEDEETAGKPATTEATAPDGEKPAEVAEGPSEPAADATPTTNGKGNKRKSVGGGVPEHKGKKLNKKKSMPNLQLDCKPGDYYWARLKGYPPWPAIVCDEEMLPESLLASRPVSTTRADGSLRDDFKEGGKNAKERTFPVMFLGTNEFTWLVNTGLTPLDPEECNAKPNGKMSKALQQAYSIATEGNNLDHFKKILAEFQEESARIDAELQKKQEEAEAKAAAKAEKDAKAKEEAKDKKKKPRKSTSKVNDDDDVEMEDAEAPKSSKKRKKDAESDGEGPKPKKTPKVTKLNAPKQTPNGDATPSKKASTAKPKKKVQAPKVEEEAAEEKKELTEAERLDQREKAILYLRHRLQKGFLSRDQAPKEEEMSAMAEFFGQLEKYDNLEPSIIRTTKIHKVLKAIVKLASIPKDEELGFKKRSADLLEIWNKRMEGEGETAPKPVADEKAPHTNGETAAAPAASEEPAESKADEGADKAEEATEKADEIEKKVEELTVEPAADKSEEKTEESAEEAKPSEEEPKAADADASAEKTKPASDDKEVDGDVSMMTAPEEQS